MTSMWLEYVIDGHDPKKIITGYRLVITGASVSNSDFRREVIVDDPSGMYKMLCDQYYVQVWSQFPGGNESEPSQKQFINLTPSI